MNKSDIKVLKEIIYNIGILSSLTNYDCSKFLYSLKHLTSQLIYFYRDVAKNSESDNIYYKVRNYPKEHDLIYVNLGRGFPKELMDGHWCYVVKNYGHKLLVIPSTSIKEDSSFNAEFDLDIISRFDNYVKMSRLSITDIRCIDLQRIDERKKRAEVLTDRKEILRFINDKIFDIETK